jgi:hypothetical protein
MSDRSSSVVVTDAGSFPTPDRSYTLPRIFFSGPRTGVPQKRIGLFALVHGDEPAGAFALLKLLQTLALLESQVAAAAIALETIFTEYRGFIAYAADL